MELILIFSLGLPNSNLIQKNALGVNAGSPPNQTEATVREIVCAWNILLPLASGYAAPISERCW